jgi:NTP pyrophosphatase (non-canonical NTP hydrolase)
MKGLNDLAQEIHNNAKSKGFFDSEKNIGEMLCLIHSEVSEALEADRNNKYCQKNMNVVLGWVGDEDFKEYYKTNIKGCFEEEMADVLIRILDLCAFKKIDIEAHIEAKMRINSLREHKHGKKY